MNKLSNLIIVILVVTSGITQAQGFLHTSGKKIEDKNGNNFIIRSIGTGNWMIQEGYMMKSIDAGIGTQWQFTEKLIQTIGKERTDTFYTAWLDNHMTKRDIDSMKAWGFNSIRPALHYKWLTPPIEEEPVYGEITWLEDGFNRLDSLVAWCTANEMYIFFDMHGAPGGQGKNADISDYNPSKPSLWESELNKTKLVALWYKIADRYKDEPYVGGYDLINETNWDFENSGNQNGCSCSQNKPLKEMFERIIDTIRSVDNNHIVFISGNCWANNYSGLEVLANFDDNLAFTFHKYWNFNDQASVQWILDKANTYNVPVWMSESGENSNTWFTNAIRLFEDNNIGWSWWPVKKSSINSVIKVKTNQDYTNLINYWNSGNPSMSADQAYNAVMKWADNHKLENCSIQYDVIDAMMRQPYSYESKPFKNHVIGEKIFCVDYDFGRNNVAYFDTDTSNYNVSTGDYTAWNAGWSYRSDGVDIESCTDNYVANDFQIGWTADGEWMQYTIENESEVVYSIDIRSASGNNGSILHFEVDGVAISSDIALPKTNGWSSWTTTTAENIILPSGSVKLRMFIDKAGSNLNYFTLKDPSPTESLPFGVLSAQTTESNRIFKVTLNKDITAIDYDIAKSDFTLFVNDAEVSILKIEQSESSTRILTFYAGTDLLYNQKIELSYNGASVQSGSQNLEGFTKEEVKNNLQVHHDIPGKIEAEDFIINNGFATEDCEDYLGGSNVSYADAGDYLDYLVYIDKTGLYKVDYRLATTADNSEIIIKVGSEINMFPIDTLVINNSGGWQTWKTQSSEVKLNKGLQTLRLYVKQGPFNLNWFKLIYNTTSVDDRNFENSFKIYPNPGKRDTVIDFNDNSRMIKKIQIYDVSGRIILSDETLESEYIINTSAYKKGIYAINIKIGNQVNTEKLFIQ